METSNELVEYKEFGLSQDEAQDITQGLSSIKEELNALEEQYVNIVMEEITPELSEQARELRLQIRDNRTKGLVKWHKANKQYFLQGGKFVDAIKNKEIAKNERMEEKLLSIEKYEENLEKERKAKLATQRLEEISPYLLEEELNGLDLSEMNDSVYASFLESSKTKYKERQEAEAKRLAEEEAERKRLAKIDEENRKLRAELKAKEDAELKAKREAEAKAKREAEEKDRLSKEPLKDRLFSWISEFVCPIDTGDSPIQEEILLDFQEFIDKSENKINNL